MTQSSKALLFALDKHGITTDDSKDLFVKHPAMVAEIVRLVAPHDDNLIAAGYLHDTLEDTQTTYEELLVAFGKDIADLVKEVTKITPKDKSKASYFPHLHSQRGLVLKFADRLHNLSRMDSWDDKKKLWYMKSSQFWKSEE